MRPDRDRKYVYCLIDGIGEEVWHWTPGARVMGVFAALCHEGRIGRDCFLSRGIPVGFAIDDIIEDDDPARNDAGPSLIIDQMTFHPATHEAEATHEIIVLHRDEAQRLKTEAIAQMRAARSLRGRMLAELWREMAGFIETEPQQTSFIFAREL